MLVVSSPELPGYRIDAALGEVVGVTVRAHSVVGKAARVLREPDAGQMLEMSQLLLRKRTEAVERMIWQARQHQANAIVTFRFDSGEVAAGWTEVCAYGTAVWVVPLTEHARQQLAATSQAGTGS